MAWLRKLPRLVVVAAAVALPACALGAIALDVAHQRPAEVSAAGSDPGRWPLSGDQPLFSAAATTVNPSVSASQDVNGKLHQRVVIAVNDSTSSTSSTEPPPSTEPPQTPPTTAQSLTTTVQVLGTTTAPPSPPASPVPGPTHYTG
jgi:hypothetical protein